jgi:NADPH2:quinone reductase
MRAAVLTALKTAPGITQFAEPQLAPGILKISVIAASASPTDLMRADGLYGAVAPPYVVGSEGVGRLADGRRVYFGHSTSPYGAWADRTIVPETEIWPIPDELDHAQAIALGVSGTGALIALEEAQIRSGERVLILGATGPVGQIALQLARRLGAGTIVGAARNPDALNRLRQRGIADEIVRLGTGDDFKALKAASADGYRVVLDAIYGPPAEAALRATAMGARMMSIGVQAGMIMSVSLRDLIFRSHAGVGTGMRPVAERRAAFERLMQFSRGGKITVDIATFSLDEASAAWTAQRNGPHAKVIVETGNH